MNTQRIDLDISKPDAITPTVTIGQGDKGGTTIEASIYDDGAEVSLAGKSAMLEVRLPDGKSYVRDGNCTISGNIITYRVDEEHVGAIAGITDDAYFDILDGPTVTYSTNRFRLKILRSAHDGAQPAESWDNAVDALIARGDAAIAAEVADGQSRITSAITEFDGRQDQNDAAQEQNDLDQLKNNSDQALNNQAAQGIISVVLASGQYDPNTRKPTITGEIGKIYLVPKTDASTSDHYIEWMWLNGAWEQIGTTETTIEGITTDEIDAVVDDETPTGSHILSLTGLSYLWAKIKDWATSTFTTGTIVNGKSITPSSVTATGTVKGSSVSDSVGSLADLRDSVSQQVISQSFTWGEIVASTGIKFVSQMGELVFFIFSCKTTSTTGTALKAPFTFRVAQGIVSHGTDGEMQGVVEGNDSSNLSIKTTKAGWLVAIGWGMVK